MPLIKLPNGIYLRPDTITTIVPRIADGRALPYRVGQVAVLTTDREYRLFTDEADKRDDDTVKQELADSIAAQVAAALSTSATAGEVQS